ncbi:MAG: class B sortase [Lachnospiraceae bacterium]|nr:class B sortase [Lachnospiraceae bacterium]
MFKRVILLIFIILLVSLIGISSYFIYKQINEENKQESIFEDLYEIIQVDEENSIENNLATNNTINLSELYKQNNDLIGWIKIDNTNIDYPVMQTVNNEYYLDHNYTQEYDKNGSIFLDKDCDITNPGTNMIIYGHHMKSGKMFGNLDKYSSKKYYEEHPVIQFDTIYEEGIYQIMYVFRSRIYNEDEIVFKYYQFFEAATPEEFDSTMQEMANISLYDTGVTATYGDKLITLSTCDHAEEDGRFVVVAKKVN